MVLGALTNPRATLEAAAREGRVPAASGVVALWALLNLLLTAVFVFGGDLRGQFPNLSSAALEQLDAALRVFAPLFAVALPFVWWIGVSGMMLLATRLFGGRPDARSLLAVVGAACAPWVAGYAIQLPLGLLQLLLEGRGGVAEVLGALGFLISLAAFLWHVALVVVGGKLAATTTYGGAGASCAVAGLGCATAGLVLGISVLTLVFTVSGAGG